MSVVRVAKRIGEAGLDQIASAFQCSPWSHLVSPETFQMRRSGIPGHGREQKSFTASTLRRSLAQYEGRSFSAVVGCFLLKARQNKGCRFLLIAQASGVVPCPSSFSWQTAPLFPKAWLWTSLLLSCRIPRNLTLKPSAGRQASGNILPFPHLFPFLSCHAPLVTEAKQGFAHSR